jgi:hypothetical protein
MSGDRGGWIWLYGIGGFGTLGDLYFLMQPTGVSISDYSYDVSYDDSAIELAAAGVQPFQALLTFYVIGLILLVIGLIANLVKNTVFSRVVLWLTAICLLIAGFLGFIAQDPTDIDTIPTTIYVGIDCLTSASFLMAGLIWFYIFNHNYGYSRSYSSATPAYVQPSSSSDFASPINVESSPAPVSEETSAPIATVHILPPKINVGDDPKVLDELDLVLLNGDSKASLAALNKDLSGHFVSEDTHRAYRDYLVGKETIPPTHAHEADINPERPKVDTYEKKHAIEQFINSKDYGSALKALNGFYVAGEISPACHDGYFAAIEKEETVELTPEPEPYVLPSDLKIVREILDVLLSGNGKRMSSKIREAIDKKSLSLKLAGEFVDYALKRVDPKSTIDEKDLIVSINDLIAVEKEYDAAIKAVESFLTGKLSQETISAFLANGTVNIVTPKSSAHVVEAQETYSTKPAAKETLAPAKETLAPAKVDENTPAKVTITRSAAFTGSLVVCGILVDGTPVCDVRAGQVAYATFPAGHHVITTDKSAATSLYVKASTSIMKKDFQMDIPAGSSVSFSIVIKNQNLLFSAFEITDLSIH